MEKVSVVIPVYNAEKYLKNCLESVILQTYRNLEIICIDDGSTDSSSNILNGYSKSDKRIKIISRENHGLLASRVEGLRKTTGEYILNLDADDYLETNAIEILMNYMRKYNADVVRFGFFVDESSSSKINYRKTMIHRESFEPIFYNMFFKYNIVNSAWGEFFKKDKFNITEKINSEITMGEDIEYNLHLYPYISSMMLVDDKLYHYRTNISSITQKRDISVIKNNINSAYKAYYNLFHSLGVFKVTHMKYYEEILATRLITEIFFLELKLLSLENTSNKKEIFDFMNEINSIIKSEGFYEKTSGIRIFVHARRHKVFGYFMFHGYINLSRFYAKAIYNPYIRLRGWKDGYTRENRKTS